MTWRQFQETVGEILSSKGFWVYETINKPSGQPVDIIAAKSNVPYIIECKSTKGNRFPLDRVECNQILAIERFTKKGNKESWFAFWFSKHPDDVLFVRAYHILHMVKNKTISISYEELKELNEEL